MMNDPKTPRQPEAPSGLCDTCRHRRVVENDRGGVFIRCDRARLDSRFPRYPRLPVLACPGYERADEVG